MLVLKASICPKHYSFGIPDTGARRVGGGGGGGGGVIELLLKVSGLPKDLL